MGSLKLSCDYCSVLPNTGFCETRVPYTLGLGEISDFKIKTRPLDLDRKFNFKTGILSSTF